MLLGALARGRAGRGDRPVKCSLALLVRLLLAPIARADPMAPSDIYVIDGDTIDVHGKRIRLVGFDAP
jgi:endonuclease YncB( thermonuclease family)